MFKVGVSAMSLLIKGAKGESLLYDCIYRTLWKAIEARNINDIIVGDATEPKKLTRLILKDMPHDLSSLGNVLPKDWDYDRHAKECIHLGDALNATI